MPSRTESSVLITRLALATYGVRLGEPTMTTALAALAQAGSAEALMNGLFARDLGSLSLLDAATRIVDNIGITGTARADAVAYLVARWADTPASQRGAVIVEAVDLLAGLVNDANFGNSAAQFNTEVARLQILGGPQDVYVRTVAAAANYAPWIAPTSGGGGGTGGGDTGGGGTGGGGTGGGGTGGGGTGGGGTGGGTGSTLDVRALSDSIAAAVGNDSLPSEGLEIVLSRSPSTRYLIDKDNDGSINASEITVVTPTLGVDSVQSGGANDRVSLSQHQLRVNAVIDLGTQQDNTSAASLRKGADAVTLLHGDIDNNGVSDAADAPFRPTLALSVTANSESTVVATGGALVGGTKAQYTLRGVEVLDLQQAATSDRHDDSIDVSALAGGATLNLGPARTVGASYGGGLFAGNVAELDANVLDANSVAPVGTGLGRERLVINGLTLVERYTGSSAEDRLIPAADVAMQSVGSGSFALALAPVRTRLDQSTAEAGGFADITSQWEDQGLYRFDLGAGSGDMLDYAAETATVSVSVGMAVASVDRAFVGAPGAGNGRIDIATNVERYFGGLGQNWIDLAAATAPTTLQFSRYSGASELAEPNGQPAGGTGVTRGAELRNSGDNTVYAVFVDRSGTGGMPASAWSRVQGSGQAETIVMTDAEVGVAHQLQLAGGANRVDYSALSFPVVAAIGSVNVAAAALPQTTSVSDDIIQQFLGANPTQDVLTLVGTGASGDRLEVTALSHGIVTRANPQLPTTSQVDPAFHVVDLVAGTVTESFFGQYEPAGSVGIVVARGFVTRSAGFESASNAGDGDIVHLIGDGGQNSLAGGNAADVIAGGRGIAGSGSNDVGQGQRGDRLTGGAGEDVFLYRGETESPGGSIGGGQQASGNFGGSEFNVTNARDTIADFAPGGDKLMFVVGDGFDSLRPNAPMPPTLAGTLNAAVPLATAFALASTTVDIGKNAAAAGTVDDFDNYRIDNLGVTLSIADLALRVLASPGANIIDASAGLAVGALNAVSNDGMRVDIVYSAASQSQAGGYDQVVHFRSGSDRIDLSFLKIPRTESARAGNGVAFDVNGNNVVDALETGLLRSIGAAPVLAVNAPLQGMFIDNGTWRPVAAQTQSVASGSSTVVFVDADADGNYSPSTDMVLVLVGINGVANGDFVVDLYGGLWGG